MITSPSLMAPLTGELACTSQGFAPLLALMRNAWPPGMPSTAKYFALGLSGCTFQTPFESLLMVLVQMSSSATTAVPKAKPANRNTQSLMRQPPVVRVPAMQFFSGFQIRRKKIERALPRQFGRGLVVTRRARIVVEPVLCTGIHVEAVRHAAGVKRRAEVRDTGIDALVSTRVMQHHRRPEPARGVGGQLRSVETHGAVHAHRLDRRAQRQAAAIAEAHHADLAVVDGTGR